MLDVPDGEAERQAGELGVSGDFLERVGKHRGLRVGGERVYYAALRKGIAKVVCAVGQGGGVAGEEGDGHVALRGMSEHAGDADALDIENVSTSLDDSWSVVGG